MRQADKYEKGRCCLQEKIFLLKRVPEELSIKQGQRRCKGSKNKMNDYERQLFSGKCPYTDMECTTDKDCIDCEVEAEERNLYLYSDE